MLKSLFVLFKGFFIGGAMMVPGVSGGSMAMVLGVYNRLIYSIASFRKNPKKNILFLIEFCIGGLLGITLFSRFVIEPLLIAFPLPVSYFFLGAVAGGVPLIFKTAGVKKFNFNVATCPLIGIILVLLIGLIPEGLFTPSDKFSLVNSLLQVGCGIFVSAAFILPGVSISQMLLMLGLYHPLLNALKSLTGIFAFIPLGIGLMIGTLICAKFMEMAMEKFPQPTYLIIFGFLLGSLGELFPGIPSGANIPICILTFIAGFAFIYFLAVLENKKSN